MECEKSPDRLVRRKARIAADRGGVSWTDYSTLEAQMASSRPGKPVLGRSASTQEAEGVPDGEVVVTVVRKAFEGGTEQGGTDACVRLVEQDRQVEGRLDARQGLSTGEGRSPAGRPSLPALHATRYRSGCSDCFATRSHERRGSSPDEQFVQVRQERIHARGSTRGPEGRRSDGA